MVEQLNGRYKVKINVHASEKSLTGLDITYPSPPLPPSTSRAPENSKVISLICSVRFNKDFGVYYFIIIFIINYN